MGFSGIIQPARIHIRVGPLAYHFSVTVFYFCWKLQLFEAKTNHDRLDVVVTWRFSCLCWTKKTANSPGPSSTRHTQKEVGIQ